ncbi:helix-turn-helix domain-containing protein [Streptomyces varsoviensis]|uniref:helix-turn-helix domain-containing protein n=1 Tax=Streptomyces varsoviensis TaxID=67373 RepID=UPI00066214FD|nr:AraC family transcriptional regulator [Streptomyces varsoviensis]
MAHSNELVWRSSGPALRGQVLGYRGFLFGARGPGRWLVAPDGVVKVVLGFSGPLRVADAVRPTRPVTAISLISGVHATATVGERTGPVHGVTVLLTPLAAYRLLAVPMDRLACRNLDMTELLGERLRRVVGALAEAPTWGSRFALLDQLLTARLLAGPRCAPELAWAWRQLHRTAGRTSVRQLAAGTGWSHRQLERRFLEQVGLPPKSLAQVLRLQAALRYKKRGMTWAEVAAAAGYHDQPHFTRSFKAMIGCTPGRFPATRAETGRSGPLDSLPDQFMSELLHGRTTAVSRLCKTP